MNNRLIVGIGEALWDILPDGKKIGGAPANFAYHVSQLGLNGLAISAVGNDRLGNEIIDNFNQKRLNYYLEQVPYPTGTVHVDVDDEGVPHYEIKENVAWDNIPFTSELQDLSKQACAVCFGSLAQRSAFSRQTIGRFLDEMDMNNNIFKIFDINLRQNFYTKSIIEDSLRKCNVLKINDEELIIISRMFGYSGIDLKEKCIAILQEYELDILILTCGINGSYVFTSRGYTFVDTPRVDVVDTVGAGDSFTAAFISALIYGKDISFAHEFAVEISAYVCTKAGAMPKLPSSLVEKVK